MSSKSGSNNATNDWQIVNQGTARDLSFYAYGLAGNALTLDRETGNSKGFAFVTFENVKDGKKAISELKNKELNGRKISVQESRQDSSRNRKNRTRK